MDLKSLVGTESHLNIGNTLIILPRKRHSTRGRHLALLANNKVYASVESLKRFFVHVDNK